MARKIEVAKDENENVIIQDNVATPPQFRNPDSLLNLKNRFGKDMPPMTLADALLPQNLKQLSQSIQDRLTGKTPSKTASELIAEMAFK